MWFLIKGSVFFAAVLVVLSYFSSRPIAENEQVSALQMSDAISAATGAYGYIAGLCAERPDVCEKGAETFSVLGARAAEGAHVAFELLDSHFNKPAEDAQQLPAAQVALQQDPNPTPFPTEGALTTQSIAATKPYSPKILTSSVPLPIKRPIQ